MWPIPYRACINPTATRRYVSQRRAKDGKGGHDLVREIDGRVVVRLNGAVVVAARAHQEYQ